MVSEVSAIEVASTTLRRPVGDGAMARSCTSASSAPNKRDHVDRRIGDPLAQQRLGAADFGGAGQERQHRAGLGAQRPRHRVGDLPFDRRRRVAAEIARLDREGAALAFDHRRIAQELRHPRAVDGRRHHQDLQILAQPLLHVARQREAEIGIERALVEFVEQQRRDAVERGIVEHHAREHAFGDDLDPRPARHLGAEPHAIADGLADLFAERRRHARGGGAGREPARLEHDDLLARRPRLLRQHERHPRGLAGARRRDQHRGIGGAQRGGQRRQRVVDGK